MSPLRDGYSGYDGDAVIGNAPRPGRSKCECHFGPSPVHDGVEFCPRSGSMHDGWFICGPCVRHAPNLRAAEPDRGGTGA